MHSETHLPTDPRQRVLAVPGKGAKVPVWILGSSLFGAQLAAHLGLPYAFASHFAPQMMMQAVAYYREHFKPRFALVDALVRRLGKPFESVLKYESALETMTAGSFSTFVLFLEIAPESRGEARKFFLENGFSEARENTFEKEGEIVVAEYSQVSRSGLVVEMEGMRALLPPPERVAAELGPLA